MLLTMQVARLISTTNLMRKVLAGARPEGHATISTL
jgi:hypothetical protein